MNGPWPPKRTWLVLLAGAALQAQAGLATAENLPKAKVIRSTGILQRPAELADAPADAFTIATAAPRVEVCVIEGLPDKGKGTLWSSWGDGCIASDGKYYTSIGDHLGREATSYVYAYDPNTRTLRRLIDLFADLGLGPGQYGHGKIHSGIHQARNGWLYFSTYWGKHREVADAFGPDYQGSLLLRYHPGHRKLENLGAMVPRQGLPASYFDTGRQILYFYAVYDGDLCAFDIDRGERVFLGGGDVIEGNRAFMGDGRGRIYVSGPEGKLLRYDPATRTIASTGLFLPQGPSPATKAPRLRAAAPRPARDGTLYGMTAAGQLFAYSPGDGEIRDLGPNFAGGEYTAVMAIGPDDRYLYYAPGAHGSGNRLGAPVVRYEIATGQRFVLCFLRDILRRELRWNIGGTYNLQLDPGGERLFITFNGAPHAPGAKKPPTFGQPAVVVVHLPEPNRSVAPGP